MSHRIDDAGRLIDRSKPLRFSFDGKPHTGYAGDTLASALLGAGVTMVGRSFKYHRPRGIVASGVEEPNALVNLGSGNKLEPNQRATTTELFDNLEARSQNVWPSLAFDIGVVNQAIARFLPAGFYYKTFMFPRAAWKHLFEPFIRQSAGLGKAPDAEGRDEDTYEHSYHHTDVLVIGGGVAGLTAAKAAAAGGAKVMVLEQEAHWGGRTPVEGGEIDGMASEAWIAAAVEDLAGMDNVTLRTRTMGAGVYDHGYALGYERVSDHTPGDGRPRHRLWRIRAKQIVTATGALERPLSFPGNDVPGVMLASAVRDYAVNYGVAAGRRTLVVTNNDDGYLTALVLKNLGLDVVGVVDARATATGANAERARKAGIKLMMGKAVAGVKGKRVVTGAIITDLSGKGASTDVECDAIAMSGGWSPVVHLWSHCGGKLNWDDGEAMFRPDPDRPPSGAAGEAFVVTAGAASGFLSLEKGLADAHEAGRTAAKAAGGKLTRKAAPKAAEEERQPIKPVWIMPTEAGVEKRMKMWLDYQNDVKVSDVQLAAREGYQSVEHTKRYTTLGMATDQGKLSNINGLAVLSDALGQPIPQTGTTTFRPPYTPISMSAITGEARGELFQPLRRTPMHHIHEECGVNWEPVGHWRRGYAYPRAGETVHEAVNREILNTRENVGMLDASTLGKIIVKGPDAGKFMNMLYTNVMSTLGVGKCRYGLMCSENGFLSDDGVVVRLAEDSWLCHTTTGGADRIHSHMEDWLQCEWWDWKVYTANVTEQWAQIGVAGPKARAVIEALGGMDVSKDAMPFMTYQEGELAGMPARLFRISFTGELSYEIAVPAHRGAEMWEAVAKAGEPHGIQPYGTEAMHIMRAEKGFIMIGDETDGTVIPQDLGLDWAISKKKEDFLGKRAQERSFMASPDRWKLVGLRTLDGAVIPDGAYAVGDGTNANGQRNVIGRVTSTYYSPTLRKGIAMGLVHNGPDRMGEVIDFATLDGTGTVIKAEICDTCFYDKEGAKADV
ncbi:sarcosine oxidase subunit alpha family protein [Maritimibacter dapengensis]|uniref:Sarcosine oxidase subunit alpha family protein n=1 Tax=Maritimibacter dapengensis TaxID=2836868 RepID=A0ABS6T1W4_9RHOB|nr:sarcosine oxidase subunit alpha family protein [Maritimibacter dapengensis]MBV7379212.1 sarcosine oxidase subunit alpha family protein [Maritimibacter dapengensis]